MLQYCIHYSFSKSKNFRFIAGIYYFRPPNCLLSSKSKWWADWTHTTHTHAQHILMIKSLKNFDRFAVSKRGHKIKDSLVACHLIIYHSFYHSIIVLFSVKGIFSQNLFHKLWCSFFEIGLHFDGLSYYIITYYIDAKRQISLHSCCANADPIARYVQWTLNHFDSFDVYCSIICESLLLSVVLFKRFWIHSLLSVSTLVASLHMILVDCLLFIVSSIHGKW